MLIIGREADGRSELMEIMARLTEPTAGQVTLAGRNIATLPNAALGRCIVYGRSNAFIYSETLRGNMLHDFRHRPLVRPHDLPSEARRRVAEAHATGNSEDLLSSSWEDPEEAGVKDRTAMDMRALEVLDSVGLGDDTFRLGLASRIDPEAEAAPLDDLLTARRMVREQLAADPVAADLVELWDIERFSPSASIAENALFAMPTNLSARIPDLARDPLVIEFLKRSELESELLQMGLEAARIMVELFSEVSSDSRSLADFSLLGADELPVYADILKRADGKRGVAKLKAGGKAMLISLAFSLVPAKHRLGIVTPEREAMLVRARPLFHKMIEKGSDAAFVPFDPNLYAPPLTVEDNLIFGKHRLDRRGDRRAVERITIGVIEELGLASQIRRAGLDFHVGVAGSRLSANQRERLTLARLIYRNAPIALVDGLLDGPAGSEPSVRDALLRACEGRPLVVTSEREDLAHLFDTVVRLTEGRIVTTHDETREAAK